MNPPATPRSFLHESAFAFAASVVAAAAGTALGFILPADIVLRTVVAGLGFACALRALRQAGIRTGQLTTLVSWAIATAAAWWLSPALPAFIAIQLAMVWLVRALYLAANLREAVLEFGLAVLAVCFGAWAAVRTDSLFIAVWSCLLVLAVSTLLTPWPAAGDSTVSADPADRSRSFAAALKAADEALQRIVASHD